MAENNQENNERQTTNDEQRNVIPPDDYERELKPIWTTTRPINRKEWLYIRKS